MPNQAGGADGRRLKAGWDNIHVAMTIGDGPPDYFLTNAWHDEIESCQPQTAANHKARGIQNSRASRHDYTQRASHLSQSFQCEGIAFTSGPKHIGRY